MPSERAAPWILALLAAGALVYVPALGGVFTFDDYQWILENPHLADLPSYGWQRRPVTLLTFAANLRAHGPDPLGFHLINVAVHLANTVLVFALARRVLPRAAGPAWAAAGAALFLLHPAQTEAVTYISGRATSLMTFWLLVAHLAALRGAAGGRVWTATAVVAFALAVGSKETALVYPLMLTAWYAVGEARGLRAGASAARPQWIAAICLALMMGLHPGYRALAGEAIAAGGAAAGPAARLENRLGLGFCFNYGAPRAESCVAARVEGLSGLARVLALPWTTNIDHGRRQVTATDVALALGVVGALVAGLRAAPGITAAASVWIAAALMPTNLIVVRSDPVADRLLYLPMVGLALAAAAAAWSAARPARRQTIAVGVGALVLLAALTTARNYQYQSEVALWGDAVRKAPRNARARVNLGYAHELRGDLDAAEREYAYAARLSPGLRWAEDGLSAVRARRDMSRGRD